MKLILASVVLALTLTISAQAAESSVKLTDVHLCCPSCVKGVQKAVSKVSGVTATSDMDEKTVSLTGPDTATLQKAVDSLVAAGYYGKSSDAAVTVSSETGAKDEKVKTLKVEDVHLGGTKALFSNTVEPNGVRLELLSYPPDSLQRKAMNAWK